MPDVDDFEKPDLRLVTSEQQSTSMPSAIVTETLHPVFSCDFSDEGKGPAAVDFMAEDDPRLILPSGKVLDSVTDCVYVVLTKRLLGELASVQALEDELGRTLDWLNVMTSVTGPTIGARVRSAYDSRAVVNHERLLPPGPQEAKELKEAWYHLNRGIVRRLELVEHDFTYPPSPGAEAWEILDRAIGMTDLDYVPESNLTVMNERFLELPPGFLKRAGIVGHVRCVYEPINDRFVVVAQTDENSQTLPLSVSLIDPIPSITTCFLPSDGGLRAEIPVQTDLSHRISNLDFSTILVKTEDK